jgi:hypothetical protein
MEAAGLLSAQTDIRNSFTSSVTTSSAGGMSRPIALAVFEPSVLLAYFAAAGNVGSFSTSRASCWMITVALEFAAIFLRRSSDAIVCARS